MENRFVVAALASLAHESRLNIFRVLVQAGHEGLAAGKVSEITGIPPSTLSFHLKDLAYAGLVSARNESRYVIYAANFETMNALVGYLTENCCGGNPCTPVNAPICVEPGSAICKPSAG